MSLFFRQVHKKTFWSQLLLGMIAMLALPEVQAIYPNEEQKSTTNQSVIQYVQSVADAEQQSFFIVSLNDICIECKPQAVGFYEFFANYYRLDKYNIYSIRAGPIVQI